MASGLSPDLLDKPAGFGVLERTGTIIAAAIESGCELGGRHNGR
jgi:hypothetical protein